MQTIRSTENRTSKTPKRCRKQSERERLRREYWALSDRWRGVLPWEERMELLARMQALAARDTAQEMEKTK